MVQHDQRPVLQVQSPIIGAPVTRRDGQQETDHHNVGDTMLHRRQQTPDTAGGTVAKGRSRSLSW